MRKRKLLSTALTLALGLSLLSPALAADPADAQLARVTQIVKTTLAVEDDYTEFYGEHSETMLGTRWNLTWYGEGKDLYVTATDAGKVLSMNSWTSNSIIRSDGKFGPSFPAMTKPEAREKARAFLNQVLTAGETAIFDDDDNVSSLNATSYGFWGTIDLNGLDSPLNFNVRVGVADGAVTSFWRDDVSDYVGSLPAPNTSTTADKAAQLLSSTLELRLEYVRDSVKEKAVLRYLPEYTDEFYVDAATGELVNLTQLQRELSRYETGGGMFNSFATADAAAPEAAADKLASLTQAELDGVAKLEGVLDKEALDKAARTWKELSLSGFELSATSYRVERDEIFVEPMPVTYYAAEAPVMPNGAPEAPLYPEAAEVEAEPAKVTAQLTYTKRTEDGVSRRYLTMDARTGELQSVSGSNAYNEGAAKVDQAAAQKKAESFLKKLWGEQFGKTELYNADQAATVSGAYGFTFAQKVNGYFYPSNTLSVRVSADDGSIMGASRYFDDGVEFDNAEGIISLETAIFSWAASYPVELSYIAVPVKLDLLGPEAKPLMDAGLRYYNALKPGYALGERDKWYYGVNAKTGELVHGEDYEPVVMAYDDLEGHWAAAALNELAQYNVGWLGGKADPNGALTQLDYIALLASADGYVILPEDQGRADSLYGYAYRLGLLTEEEREDNKVLTRGDMVQMLLDSVGYRQVARLEGIFRCDFADAESIPASHMGYAALAQALGIVSGGYDNCYAPSRPASRAEAATMLWQYMKRG